MNQQTVLIFKVFIRKVILITRNEAKTWIFQRKEFRLVFIQYYSFFPNGYTNSYRNLGEVGLQIAHFMT